MREHQIVITLKPEQFQEVQRLARASNAKSMGIFVRQQLLAALGIDGVAASEAGSIAETVELGLLAGELRRLHSELKTFVAESLSMYSLEALPTPEADIETLKHALEAPRQETANVDWQSTDSHTEMDDYLEHTAEKTFAISPRLGAIGEDISGRDLAGRDAYVVAPAVPSSPVSSEKLFETSEPLVAPARGSEAPYAVPLVEKVSLYEPESELGIQSVESPVLTGVTKHEPHSRREIHRYHQNAAKDVMDVPFTPDGDDNPVRERFEESVISRNGRDVRLNRDYSGSPARMADETKQSFDGANSVFAPPQSPFDDPLEKLLGPDETLPQRRSALTDDDADFDDEEEDDLFDVPLSIAERNRQLAAQQSGLESPADAAQAYDQPEASAEVSQLGLMESQSDVLPNAAANQVFAENTVSENLPAKPAVVPSEVPKPSTGRPLGYPPVSGNPPPKRRQV